MSTKTCLVCSDPIISHPTRNKFCSKRCYNGWRKSCPTGWRRPGPVRLYETPSDKKAARVIRDREKKYGLASGDYDKMLVEQQYRCAICQRKFIDTPHVDHDHVKNKVRGLLCEGCNRGLGFFFDDAELLVSAAKYIQMEGSKYGN